MHRMNLFRPYLDSYKGFKTHHVKVLPIKDAPLTMDGEPIPWYWRLPNWVQGLSSKDLNADDKLPRGVNYKEVVAASFAIDPRHYLIGYDLGALMQRGKVAVEGKLDELSVDSMMSPITAPIVQIKLPFKIISAPPPLSGLIMKRKVVFPTPEGEAKRAKPLEEILTFVRSLTLATINVVAATALEKIEWVSVPHGEADAAPEKTSPVVVNQDTTTVAKKTQIANTSTPITTSSGDLVAHSTSSGKEDLNVVVRLRLDSSSLRVGVKLGARNQKLSLFADTENSLKVVTTSCVRAAVIVNTLTPALLEREKLSREGLWAQQKMVRLLSDNNELRKAN
ncbi:hypothetical protein CR513_28838, partial [Mucuna pruriens]